MVCDKCEKKLGTAATPDPWKAGSRNAIYNNKIHDQDNKRLQEISKIKTLSGATSKSSSKNMTPYGLSGCRICKQKIHLPGRHYCQSCAYKKGICAMCGKKILETKGYRQSAT
ncbi:cysteine-rich PDZ-binding protein [Daktulosphaira vitifoliae]|uniref:cysteine-rich PDZ-binding protein n=1 Tax=Daktulosphaira vitifoliae TaxID=58002 RepID=UPI0021AAD62B|nr:cysteine-rich PDZ-binding protein [Daktulosphaira vitifoliae]